MQRLRFRRIPFAFHRLVLSSAQTNTSRGLKKLSHVTNIAQTVSIPLTIAVWFFTREHFVKFWKSFSWLFWILVSVLIFWTVWRLGWLDWVSVVLNSLTARVATPVWCLMLLVVLSVILAATTQMIARAYRRPEIRAQRILHSTQGQSY